MDPYLAEKNGYIPVAPIRRVVEQWALENWFLDERAKEKNGGAGTSASLAAFTGLHVDTISNLRKGRNNWIEFDMADRIVTFIDPWLWHRDEELNAIYREFSFSYLDLARPTSTEADELPLLDGFSDRIAATVLGVSQPTLSRNRIARRQKEAA
jgi:hypothetical protein